MPHDEPAPDVFGRWLGEIAERAGAATAPALRELLEAHGCHCTEATAAQWLEGRATPRPAKLRELISALKRALPDVDVWQDYARHVAGVAEQAASPRRSTPDVPSLEDILERAGDKLPPPLT